MLSASGSWYNEVMSAKSNMQKKETGTLLAKDLTDVLTPEVSFTQGPESLYFLCFLVIFWIAGVILRSLL